MSKKKNIHCPPVERGGGGGRSLVSKHKWFKHKLLSCPSEKQFSITRWLKSIRHWCQLSSPVLIGQRCKHDQSTVAAPWCQCGYTCILVAWNILGLRPPRTPVPEEFCGPPNVKGPEEFYHFFSPLCHDGDTTLLFSLTFAVHSGVGGTITVSLFHWKMTFRFWFAWGRPAQTGSETEEKTILIKKATYLKKKYYSI